MPDNTTLHLTQPSYRCVFEQAASTKGILGIKVEANCDEPLKAVNEAYQMLVEAKLKTEEEVQIG
jgi:hypothetical protein